MAGEQHHGLGAMAEGEWYIELEQGWTPWMVEGLPCQGIPDGPFRYTFGKTEFEAQFQSETEGIQTNLSTGKTRLLRKQARQPISSSEGSDSRKMHQQSPVLKRPGTSSAAKPPTAKVESLPTCYYLAPSGAQSYDGEFEWLIELEKGWTPWMPENQPFEGRTDQPLRYTLGRYDFEVNFTSESQGTQTNLATGKVRRIQRRHKAEPMPAWEGTGVRRRPVAGGRANIPAAPPSSEACVAQNRRAERRAAGGYPGGAVSNPVQKKTAVKDGRSTEMQRPRVSQLAQSALQPCRSSRVERNSDTIPHYMRGLKSRSQA
eukprot:TRINITY_DN43549_c0_g1_i1.p1 TRINITY_DN43549_c0_g1~~TRINITY_DN43549_c0_g1_i1.p1  ORF type:complete len:317 (-),score=51.23 TRINITY_DN43549_c0_g1_i1:221-1171(-)